MQVTLSEIEEDIEMDNPIIETICPEPYKMVIYCDSINNTWITVTDPNGGIEILLEEDELNRLIETLQKCQRQKEN